MKKPTDSPHPDETGPYYPHPPKNQKAAAGIGNTGLQTSMSALFQEDTGCRALVDYLAYTLHSSDIPAMVEQITDFLGSGWVPAPGRNGYTNSLLCDDIRVSFSDAPRLGVHVEAAGQGCCKLRARIVSWQGLLKTLIGWGAKFTRIDVAIDDRVGLITIAKAFQEKENGLVSTHLKTVQSIKNQKLRNHRLIGDGLTFGRPTSQTYIRIYDKALEQGVPGHWIRVELQKRRKKAQLVAKAIAEHGIEIVPNLIRANLDFKKKNRNGGRSRLPADWWWTFLDHAGKFKSTRPVEDRSRDENWLLTQVSLRLAEFYDDHEKKGPGMGMVALVRLVDHGRQRSEAKRERAQQQIAKAAERRAAKLDRAGETVRNGADAK